MTRQEEIYRHLDGSILPATSSASCRASVSRSLRRWLQHHQKLCLAVLILNRDKRNDIASEASNGKPRAAGIE